MSDVIDRMIETWFSNLDERGPVDGDGFFRARMKSALRAAKSEGWELCKLPEPVTVSMVATASDARAYNACLDEIERLELEDGDG